MNLRKPYSIVRKGHKIKQKLSSGDYWFTGCANFDFTKWKFSSQAFFALCFNKLRFLQFFPTFWMVRGVPKSTPPWSLNPHGEFSCRLILIWRVWAILIILFFALYTTDNLRIMCTFYSFISQKKFQLSAKEKVNVYKMEWQLWHLWKRQAY